MTIPPRFLDEIRNRLTLSDIIGRRIKVTRAGREFKACCPFHNEKTPSFTINDDKQFYHCFGCGAHGDAIGFAMQHDGLSFIEAVEMLAAEAGLQVPQQSPEEIEQAKKAKDLYSLMEDATSYFESVLHSSKEGKIGKTYLLDRELSENTIAAFRIGFAPPDGQALRKFLTEKGYTDQQMIEAGLIKKSTKGGDPYGFFRERIMFPVADRRGRVVAFGGRILPDHLRTPDRGDFTPPKYMNSGDTPLFDKGQILYGESHARQAAADGKDIIVVEGYMDVIACYQAGIRGAVAPMGTALTERQIVALWKMFTAEEKTPVLCFDGDKAGRSAAVRACERFLPQLKPYHSARFAFLPEGEDPDSLLRSGGAAAFQKVLDGAMPLFDFTWSSHVSGRDFASPEARAGVSKAVENQFKTIQDRDVQSHYRQLLRNKISEVFFPRRAGKGAYKKFDPISALKVRRPVIGANSIYERVLLAAVLNHPNVYESLEESFGGFAMTNSNLAKLRQAMIKYLDRDHDLDAPTLQNYLKNEGFEREIGDILSKSVYVHASFCSPPNDSGTDSQDVVRKWLKFQQDGEQGQNLKNEMRSGWKQAFANADEEEEEKLRQMAKVQEAEGRG